jgi:hypothetical protein
MAVNVLFKGFEWFLYKGLEEGVIAGFHSASANHLVA